MPVVFDYHGLTDIGRKRDSNQDQFLIADLRKSMTVLKTSVALDHQARLFGESQGMLLAVADGMGGHAAGERASSIAVDTIMTYVLNSMHWFFRLEKDCEVDFIDELKQALEACHASVTAEGARVPQHAGMGTTLTLAYVMWPRLFVVHAGDSRCYLLRQSRLEQVTTDHSMAQKLMQGGSISPEEAINSRWSRMLWKVIGGQADVVGPEVYQADLQPRDALLLCSDGLTRHLTDEQIVAIIEDSPAEEACQRLVNAAVEAGGTDNVTVVMVRFQETPADMGKDSTKDTTASFNRDTDVHIEFPTVGT